MKSLNIAVLAKDPQQRAQAAQAMAKKGTADDLGFYHTVYAGKIVSVVDPAAYPAKLSCLLQALQLTDYALVLADAPSPELGELIISLDALHKSAVFVSAMDLAPFLKNSSLEKSPVFATLQEAKAHLLELESPAPAGASETYVDHAFEVQGVGTVALGMVKQGTVAIHDKLTAWPAGKEVEVRSIQMNDADVKLSEGGGRVGLALKNTKSDDLPRGTVLAKEGWSASKEFQLDLTGVKFLKSPIESGAYHVSLGLQFEPVMLETAPVKAGETAVAKAKSDKPLAVKSGLQGLLCNLNAKGLRVLGKATVR